VIIKDGNRLKYYLQRAHLWALFLLPNPPSPSPVGEEAVRYIFNYLHNYHINFISLLCIFEEYLFLSGTSQSVGCALQVSPNGGDLEGAGANNLFPNFRPCPLRLSPTLNF